MLTASPVILISGFLTEGKNDVERHCKTASHTLNDRTARNSHTITNFFSNKDSIIDDKVTRAEVLFAGFVAEHNLSFMVADHFSELVKEMFPDSAIAKKFACKRQKTVNIVNQAIAPELDRKVTDLCRKEKFTVMMDESNDKGDNKCVAILMRVADRTERKIKTGFLSIPICNIGTGANLFACLEQVFM